MSDKFVKEFVPANETPFQEECSGGVRPYVPLPDEFLYEMEELSDAEYGRLIRAYQRYHITEKTEKLSGNERFFYKRVCNCCDRYSKLFAAASQKKREAGKKGAQARWSGKNSSAIFQDGKNGNTDTDTKANTDTKLSTAGAVDNARATTAVRDPAVAQVMTEYMDKINPTPSPICLDELIGFAETLGAEVCIYAIHKALDEKCTKWSYIKGILRNFAADGVRCLADIQAQDDKHRAGYTKNSKQGKQSMYQKHDGELSDLEKKAIARALEEGDT